MISHLSRYFRPSNSTLLQTFRHRLSTTKKLKDSDELSTEELSQLLGKQIIQQKQTKKQQKQISANNEGSSVIEKDKAYYYGLMPLKNQNYPECIDPDQYVIEETPNQNIFKDLALPDSCCFADYTLALNKYRTEVDLYGDQQQKHVIENNSLEFKELLDPQCEYMKRARKYHMINISIPGSIQCQDPRNFLELRPVQQFRHTPLVPISDSYMQKHKEMLERYHRKQFVFEVSKQKMINWFLVSVSFSVGGYFLYMILQKEEERTVSFSRLKYQRLVGQSGDQPVFKI